MDTLPDDVEQRLVREIDQVGSTPPETVLAEIAPAVSLLLELRGSDDLDSFEYRECLTVFTLLGRRLALLDSSASAAVRLVDVALRIVHEVGSAVPVALDERARAAVAEGFALGREEHIAGQHRRRASDPIRPLRVHPDAFLLLMTGAHDADVLREHIDALGRALLEGNAAVAWIDVSQMARPTPELVAALFSADAVLRVAGAATVFSGVDYFWKDEAQRLHVPIETLCVTDTFEQGLRVVLSGGPKPKRSRTWRGLFRRKP